MEEKFGISTKKFMLGEVMARFRSSPDFVITNYKGLSASEIEKLRRALGKASSKYFVVKNSIVKRVFDELKLKDLGQFIEGEIGIGFAGDIIKASRAFMDFKKSHKTFNVSGAYINGKPEGVERVKYLAMLPPKEQLLAMAVTYMKSPITGFVGVLNGLLRSLVVAINEIRIKKEK